MTFSKTSESDESFRMIAIKVFTDHRQMEQSIEFRIDPSFYEEVIVVLDKFAKRTKDTSQDEDGDSELSCEAGFEGCDHDDPESMSDECKLAAAEAYAEARADTFDY